MLTTHLPGQQAGRMGEIGPEGVQKSSITFDLQRFFHTYFSRNQQKYQQNKVCPLIATPAHLKEKPGTVADVSILNRRQHTVGEVEVLVPLVLFRKTCCWESVVAVRVVFTLSGNRGTRTRT